MNPELRQFVLERDNHECQLSKLFGIAHLSGQPCSKDLEVHHVTYKRIGRESPSDVITVCQRCHEILTDAIRQLRYSKVSLSILAQDHEKVAPSLTRKENQDEIPEVSDCVRITPTYA